MTAAPARAGPAVKLNSTVMDLILLGLFYILMPILILHLCHKYRYVNKLGAVMIAYAVGLLLGNIGVLPEEAIRVQDLLTTLTIPLALPLLLFSMNIRKWFSIVGKTLVSMFIAFFAVISMVVLGYFLFRGHGIEELWKVSGMLIGVYTGGTPNLASIKLALDVDETIYVVTHTYDLLIGVVYLMFMLTVGQRFFLRFLPAFRYADPETAGKGDFDGMDPYWGILRKKVYLPLLKALGLSVLIFGLAGGLSLLVPDSAQMAVVILLITTLGILSSLIPSVNRIEKTFELGMYFILVFSIVVASMADISRFLTASPVILFYVSLAVFGSLLVQVILSRIFRIDADTLMITSTAFICSPPFVPVVAGALKNREIIVSGLSVGIVGYAVGNYLGITIAYLLR
jgi:uncharacterized membrane protein